VTARKHVGTAYSALCYENFVYPSVVCLSVCNVGELACAELLPPIATIVVISKTQLNVLSIIAYLLFSERKREVKCLNMLQNLSI